MNCWTSYSSIGEPGVHLRARLAPERSVDVGQSLRAACAQRFQFRRTRADAPGDCTGGTAGL